MRVRLRQRKNKKNKKRKSNPTSEKTYSKSRCIKLVKAIRGSGGKRALIAKRLGLSKNRTYVLLRNAPDWVREELRMELDSIVDVAEDTVMEMMQQRLHFPTAATTAKWVLEHHPQAEQKGYKNRKELTIEGGKKPLKVEQDVNVLSMDKLKSIPVEVRKKMLEEMEAQEAEDEKNN